MGADPRVPVALTIAGSDSGGGAGIQADLKAFAACGVHGASAITALTAQNTVGVEAVLAVPGEFILAQVRAVASDLGVDAVKVGMLGDLATIDAVCEALAELVGHPSRGSAAGPPGSAAGPPGPPVVVDPVMVAESGAELLAPDAVDGLIARILPLAAVATPNLSEARRLSGLQDASPQELARAVRELGPAAVVVTGGHGDDGADVFFDGERLVSIGGPRHPDGASHGSGCTHSSALAAHLALGFEPLEAARLAREVASRAVRDGLGGIGSGAGPVDVLGVVKRRRAIIDR